MNVQIILSETFIVERTIKVLLTFCRVTLIIFIPVTINFAMILTLADIITRNISMSLLSFLSPLFRFFQLYLNPCRIEYKNFESHLKMVLFKPFLF